MLFFYKTGEGEVEIKSPGQVLNGQVQHCNDCTAQETFASAQKIFVTGEVWMQDIGA